MFHKINDRTVVNLEDVSYVVVEMNQRGVFELRIFLKQVEHYMFLEYIVEADAIAAFEELVAKLKF